MAFSTSESRMKSNKPTRAKPSKLIESLPNKPAIKWLAPTVVALATCATFLPVLWNQFVNWDDYENLVSNPNYRGLGWSQIRWMFTTFHMGHYQPLSWVTLAIDYLLWGLNPLGYHLTNLIIHTANAIFVYFISRQLLSTALSIANDKESWRLSLSAAFAALLFAIHPLRVESVAWATERRDVLSGCFFLWAIYCYLRAALSPQILSRRRWLWTAVVIYSLSLFSKATAMTLPAVLLLLDFYPLRRLQGGPINWFRPQLRSVLWEKVPFLVLAIVFAAIALLAQHSIGALKPLPQYDATSRVAQAFYGVIFYLWKALLPTRLSPLYELPYDPEPWFKVFLLAAVGAVAISLAVYFLRRQWPALLACWLYYIVMLAPVLGIAQAGPQLVADRYSYLPCLSWALPVAGGLFFYWPASADPQAHRRRLVTAFVMGIVAVFVLGFLTWTQIGVWRDTRTLWERVLTITPESSIAHYNLGKTLETEGRVEQAIELYSRAVTLNPGYADAHHNLARLLARRGQQDQAVEHYRRALEIQPNDADTHNNLGLLLAIRGDIKSSLEELHTAVQIDPKHARAYFNMARIFARRGDLEKAVGNYQQALKLDPNEVEIELGLGNVLARQGKLEAATMHFQQAVNLKPDLADAHVELARLLAAQGRKNEAEKHYQEALRLMKSQNPR